MNTAKQNDIRGRYRHYKGNEYEVIGMSVHTETAEKTVVYRALVDPDKIWNRPYDMFFESVKIDGKIIARFERID